MKGQKSARYDDLELGAALRAIAPDGVRVGLRRITARDVAALMDVELAHVQHAVSRRKSEFASGRVLLRELIRREVAIPVAGDRSPVLPAGLCGSLAHDDELVIAAISEEPSVLAIGIDVEPETPLEADVTALVLRADDAAIDAHLAFTLKEATYKAWSGLGGRMLDHDDVRLAVTAERFQAEIVAEGETFRGSWALAAGRWIALVIVREGTPARRPSK